MTPRPLLSWTPAAVVFDCDGTLMDTERHWMDARQRVFDDLALTPTPGFATRAKGLHYTQCGQLIADEAARSEQGQELAGRLLQYFRNTVSEQLETMPGAREIVEATAAFAPLAVASNCPREVVESCLDATGLLGHFRAVVVPDEQIRPKPDPDVYLTAARYCEAAPADTLAVEDTHCGILAAKRAGLRILGVGPWPGDETAALTDLWIDTLQDPRIREWTAQQAASRTPSQQHPPAPRSASTSTRA
ncbi:HAD family hydrolase [Streptomyces sp. NPDC088789]|uniref:HAD family hydrolase n=1 Tax=Streptomyces sp. NPDC088789 TaxID=3365899 RepID=UPI0037FB0A1B